MKNFHAVRLLSNKDLEAIPSDVPVIVVANHPSWWDPMLAIFLGDHFAENRQHYAPIEDVMLEKYGIFKRLGFFGIEKDSVAGLKDFLRAGQHIMQNSEAVLWMTPQGEFVDMRQRPIELKAGFSQLASKSGKVAIVTLAIEYTFWSEKKPELLCRLGKVFQYDGADAKLIHQQVTEELESGLDALAEVSMQRQPSDFETILSSEVGVGGIYGLWQSLRGKGGGHQQ